MNRKASLNLSIQAIVIVVIAFVVLGLGLSFVRSQFSSIESTSTAVQEQINQQILDDLRTGNKKLTFPATKLVLETNEESVQAIGLKNTGDEEASFTLGFEIKASDCGGTEDFCVFTSEDGMIFTKGVQTGIDATIIWDNSAQTLGPGESRVFPVTIVAPSKSGNFLYKVVVTEETDAGLEPYDSRTFFIKTS